MTSSNITWADASVLSPGVDACQWWSRESI